MTESQIEAVNFDKFKTKYTNDLRLSEECAASADALLQTDTGLAFVEFKKDVYKRQVLSSLTIGLEVEPLLISCVIIVRSC